MSVPFRMALLAAAGAARLITADPVAPTDWVVLFHDDFEKGLAPEWSIGATSPGVSWAAETDGNNTVLAGSGHITIWLRNRQWSDYRFRSRVRMIGGGLTLNFRSSGCARYFVALSNNRAGLSRTSTACEHSSLQASSVTLATGAWHVVEIVGIGAAIRVYLNGVLTLEATDPDPMLSGSVGFECQSGRVEVDDVEISGPAILQADRFRWTRTGGPVGGMGYDVRMRPDNPDVLFATDVFSGISKSVDGGNTWTPANTGLDGLAGMSGDAYPVFCLTVDAGNPDVAWAGTINLRGIFKSVDGGATWTPKVKGIVEQFGITFRGFTVDPRDSNTIYVSGEVSSPVWAGRQLRGREFDLTKGVVYRSTDGGENWTPFWRGDNLARYVWVDPRDSNVVYISTGIFDREAANSDIPAGVWGGVGIAKTTDGGRTWRNLNESNGLAALYIGSLFMHPSNPDTLLAGVGLVGLPPEMQGVFLSTDGGESWKRGVLAGNNRALNVQITSVEFAISDPRIAYAAGSGAFYRSSDGGQSWVQMAGAAGFYGPPGIRTGFPVDLQVDPRNADRVFINNYGGGNFLSEDGGRTWAIASRGYTGAQIRAVAVDPRDASRVYTIGRSGPFRSDDGGENWQGITWPGDSTPANTIAVDPADPERVFTADEFMGILQVSTDRGEHWTAAFRHPDLMRPDPVNRHGFASIVFAPGNARTVYAGMRRDRNTIDVTTPDSSYGIYKSLDAGKNWRPSNDGTMAGQNVSVIAVHPGDENVVYAGTVTGGVFRSQDGGLSWQAINRGLRGLDVRALAIHPTDPLVVYAGVRKGGVYKSVDGGGNWKAVGAGLDPSADVWSILFDPGDPRIVYAADVRSGVYRSSDGGQLWVQLNNGLSTRAVTHMAISADGAFLYAGTEGGGVFRLDLRASSTGGNGTAARQAR